MENIEIEIDGRKVLAEQEETILEAALRNGIYIPNLCSHPDLKPFGACRLCLVKVNGNDKPITSCNTIVKEGMVIHTDTEEVSRLRRLSMELILTEHPEDCSTCWKYGKCEMQSMLQCLGVSSGRMRTVHQNYQDDTGNPLFVRDMNRCIKCGRCVRMCREVRGADAMDYLLMPDGRLGVGNTADDIQQDQCRLCTACVEVCPTGALRDREGAVPFLEAQKQKQYATCRHGCPAHTDIPSYIRSIKEGDYDKAVRIIREKIPIPGIAGYVCAHPCEAGCRRGVVSAGEQIAIRDLKRFAVEHASEEWKERRIRRTPSGRRIAIIGAGPAGLTAAYYLNRQGHDVTIYEALPEAGGMVRYGIPDYRIPKTVINRDVEVIKAFGVNIETGTEIASVKTLKKQGYDAVLVAVGAHQGVKLPIPGNELEEVLNNIDFLRATRMDHPIIPGRRVVVLGGGNVAFDCARLAKRLGTKEVHIACLEEREKMTASAEEIAEGEAEGIKIHSGCTFVEIVGAQGKVAAMKLAEVEAFTFDDNRRAVIKVREDSDFEIPCDTVIFAVGQKPEGIERFGLALERGSYLKTDVSHTCSVEGIFATGDVVTGTKTVIDAIVAARLAAISIDKYLGGDGDISENLVDLEEPSQYIGKKSGFRTEQRIGTAAIISSEQQARCEAERCLQCDLRDCIRPTLLYSDFEVSRGEQIEQ